MSKSVVPASAFGKLPAHLQSKTRLAQEAANEYITNTGTSGPRISLRGRRFRIRRPDMEAEQALPEGSVLNVVLLGADPERGTAKVFYQGEYEPDSNSPPDCSSADGRKPDGWIQDPQAESCDTCPNNVWGTAKRGKGKACRDVKRLYVVPPTQLDGDIYQLQVPPASLKHLSKYVRELAGHGVAPQYVVTQINFEDAEYPIINFKFVGFLDAEQTKIVDDRIEGGDVKAAVEHGASAAPENEEVEETATPAASRTTPPPAPDWAGGASKAKPAGESPRAASRKSAAKAAPAEPKPQAAEETEQVQVVEDEELSSILKQWGN